MSHASAYIKSFMIAMLMAAAFIQIGGCSSAQLTQEELAQADFGTLPSDYRAQVRAWFSGKLIDPSSAQYGFYEPTKARYGRQYGWLVIVDMNAKNRFGGYVGEEQYNFFFPNGDPMRQVDVFATSMINSLSN